MSTQPTTHLGVVTRRELDNEVVSVGHLGRLDDLVHGGARLAHADVLGDAAAKQHGLLPDKAHLVPATRFAHTSVSLIPTIRLRRSNVPGPH